MFGLINANARLYSPYLGRFVSPDPLLNSEGGPLLYNPYIYANNNPFKYIDRGGEEPITLTALLIGFAVGGTINVACNWENIHDVGDFCAFFGVGGTAGIAGVAAAALAPAGAIAGALYGAVGGALSGTLLGGGNALLLGQDPWKAALTGMWQGAATGVILGGLTGGAKAIDGNKSWLTGSPKVKANPAANISATPKEMLSAPSKGSQPNYPEVIDYKKDVGGQYYVEGTLDENVMLPKGTVIDRFSSTHEGLLNGTFCGEQGTPYINRGLLYDPAKGGVYGKIELLKDLRVQRSIVAPLPKFNIPGGGVQYQLFQPGTNNIMTIQQMVDAKYIKVIEIPF